MPSSEAACGDTEGALRRWVRAELRPWQASPLRGTIAEQRLRAIAERDDRICLFRIADGDVTIDPATARQRPTMCDPADLSGQRAAVFQTHFTDAIRRFDVRGRALVGMFIADGYPDPPAAPLLCFQKPVGARGILVPDIDLLSHDYCLDTDGQFDDPIPFEQKIPEAVFVGSTTGRRIASLADVTNGTNERLAAALFFQDEDGVTFRLPSVVQCSAKVRAAVEALGVTGSRKSWAEQQHYRYMLSLDGNGATCSRVATALHGRQVLAKYASPNLLYYFHGLQPWRDFVPIAENLDVLALVREADEAMEWHSSIAESGRSFAKRFLTRLPIQRYTALLLSAYIARFGEGGRDIGEPELPLLDCAVGVAGHRPRWGEPSGWNDAADRSIERVTFFSYGLAREDFVCEAIGLSGAGVRSIGSGEGCRVGGEPLAGLRVSLSGQAAERFSVAVQERFADGSIREMAAAEPLLPGPAPLIGFGITWRACPAPQTRRRGFFRRAPA